MPKDLSESADQVRDAFGATIQNRWTQGILIISVVLCLLTVPWLSTLMRNQFSNGDIAAERLPAALEQLERALGYDGFIHNFKNSILRPSEPVYYDRAVQDYESARTLLDEVQSLVIALGTPLDISALENTLQIYRESLDVARKAAADGLSIAQVDARVRTPDEAARLDIDHIHNVATQARERWLAQEKDRSLLQIAGLSALLLVVAAVLLLFVIASRRARADRLRDAAELKDRLAATGQVTAGIAHDVNNLLATIYYAVELSLADDIPATSKKFLGSARRAIERGQSLTGRLLSYARPQAGNARDLPIATLMTEVSELIQPNLPDGISLRIVEETEGLSVFCDQSQAASALLNLALNSRDAMTEARKGRQITLIVRRGPDLETFGLAERNTTHPARPADPYVPAHVQARGFVEIIVRDDGPGIPPEIRHRTFEPFYTTKSASSGSGLGLSIVYSFTQSSGGDMKIVSARGEGTSVHLLLPAGAPGDAPGKSGPVARDVYALTREQVQERALATAREGSPTVLLVEDEDPLRELIAINLQEQGFTVIEAANAQQALQKAEAGQPFDILVTDIVMPGPLDGFALAQKLRDIRGDLPVLYQTGNAGREMQRRMTVAAPVLIKPCSPAKLSNAIRQALNGVPPDGQRAAG